ALYIAEGDYKGLRVQLTQNKEIIVMPQISLRKINGDWDYFLIDEIGNITKEKYALKNGGMRSFSLTDEETIQMFKKLEINFITEGNIHPPNEDILVEIRSKIDRVIRRTVAKIAFNYFAYFNYKYIVLNGEFDKIRDFILKGDFEYPIKIEDKAVLYDEQRSSQRRLGHLITINRNCYGMLLAQVSLFNFIKYTIPLASTFYHEKINIGFGHIFDITNREIHKLGRTPLNLV
ncbi:hypothetical protein, partial [Legionella pneumophila]